MTVMEWYKSKFKDENFNIEELIKDKNYEFINAKTKLENEKEL